MKLKLALILIIILGACLRLYHLNTNPPSLDWDEAAIGWNAKTIFHTRRDEYGTRLPLSFKSFGDYKAPVYIYLTAPLVGLFGLTPVNIRLVSVIAGSLSILLIYFITLQLWPKKKYLKLISAFLLATCPWHILLSRPAFEPNLALFFILLGLALFLNFFKKPIYLCLAIVSFVIALYSYQSPKIFLPFFGLGLIYIYLKRFSSSKAKLWLLASAIIGLTLITPLIKEMIFGNSASRFQGTSIFYSSQGEPQPLKFALLGTILNNYLLHYSPSFLFSGSQDMPRLQLKNVGPLLIIEAPFLLLGLYYLFKNRRQLSSQLILWWLLVGPLPAIIGREVPHPIRGFNVLPALIITIALGVDQITPKLKSWLKLSLLALFSFNFFFFISDYFFQYPVYAAQDWQYGYQEAAQVALEYQDQVNKIIFTSAYGQPHIFTYVYQNRRPLAVFWGALSQYIFRDLKWPEDETLSNTLLIGTSEEIPSDALNIIRQIYFPDGQVAFRVVKTL